MFHQESMMPTRHRELLEYVQRHAVKRGRFTLASGLISDYYIDGKLVTFSPEGLHLTVAAIREELAPYAVRAIGGLDMGATPIVAAFAHDSFRLGQPCDAFVVRKVRKAHGTRNEIEGNLVPGCTVAIVDDVVTSGTSILKAIEAVRHDGCVVAVAITLVDRDCGAAEALGREGVPYRPLLTIADLGLSNVHTRPGAIASSG
jgi:orotate phosphoribosyltransferase